MKALVLDETRAKFLIMHEEQGVWDLPGGGLDWGTDLHAELRREIKEETNLEVTWIEDYPSYVVVSETNKGEPKINIIYETELENLNFTPSDECTEVRFVDVSEIESLNVLGGVAGLAKQFDPERHRNN